MNYPTHHLCTVDNGPRPAGSPDKCFYCGVSVGQTRTDSCVCRIRSVVVQVTFQYPILVPESWTPSDIEAHRNNSSWCAGNMFQELRTLLPNDDLVCLCGDAEYQYVREATKDDEAIWPGWQDAVSDR